MNFLKRLFCKRQPNALAYNIIWFNRSTWVDRLISYGKIRDYEYYYNEYQ